MVKAIMRGMSLKQIGQMYWAGIKGFRYLSVGMKIALVADVCIVIGCMVGMVIWIRSWAH